MATAIDRHVNFGLWADFLQRRLDATDDALSKQSIGLYLEHLHSERLADVDRFMAHMSSDVLYRRFGVVNQELRYEELRYEDVRNSYAALVALGPWPEYEVDPSYFFVDGAHLCWQGVLKSRTAGHILTALNVSLPVGGTAQDDYLQTCHMAAFFDFTGGKLVGEDTFRSATQLEIYRP